MSLAALTHHATMLSTRSLSRILVHPIHGDIYTAIIRICALRGESLADVFHDLLVSERPHLATGDVFRRALLPDVVVDWRGWKIPGGVMPFAFELAVFLGPDVVTTALECFVPAPQRLNLRGVNTDAKEATGLSEKDGASSSSSSWKREVPTSP